MKRKRYKFVRNNTLEPEQKNVPIIAVNFLTSIDAKLIFVGKNNM